MAVFGGEQLAALGAVDELVRAAEVLRPSYPRNTDTYSQKAMQKPSGSAMYSASARSSTRPISSSANVSDRDATAWSKTSGAYPAM